MAISLQLAVMATASEMIKKNAEDITQLRTTMAETKSAQPPPNPLVNAHSYSTVVQQSAPIPAPISAALTRAATKERQILLEPITSNTLYEPNENFADTAKKYEQLLTAIQTTDSPDLLIKATTHLQNGGLIIELTTAEAANWIHLPENRVRLTEALNLSASIKE
ncbi:uncharacterized protein BJ212DRAFT_1480458 [Suillus subaureus]|uniref:Uncharacterized protein n=1 Tax=Suillus subaureus TaxID=48587 RepID=A0A9P7EC07_9AGAM|nr:uncharacterized protein BJ212DRAFT_1480458 [Suillus subaureus]KAG1817231.1 hypothetical protein BJ212DRAFT_1480458 [Suillus subaureus]